MLVDASSFFLRDAHNAIGRLKRTNQGNYKLDLTRSAFSLPNTKNFPYNTEIEAILTFTCDDPGIFVEEVAPDAASITLRQHHSFIRLPDNNYKPRIYDPRANFSQTGYIDFAAPIEEPIIKRFISRHRLHKKDPKSKISDPVKPIIYYIDRGAPEPIRSSLIEGASWWNEAPAKRCRPDRYQIQSCQLGSPVNKRLVIWQFSQRSTNRGNNKRTCRPWFVASSSGFPDRRGVDRRL
ncbi:hypothetical protein ES705_43544 [subsurface metagenome]